MADVLRRHWVQVVNHSQINAWQLRTLGAIMRCRTADMGGHIDKCTTCAFTSISYNSCRNRHCPKCQIKEREKWIEARKEELLPVSYFHVVFTLPDILNQTALCYPKEVYDALFEAAWATINVFGHDSKHIGAQTGMISILHTWGQTLTLHPHLHCIVPGGGLTKSGMWKPAKSKAKYLFPVKAMSKVFRAKFACILKYKIPDLDKDIINALFKKQWVVYAKRPFQNVNSVIEYLGRYTHKIAISNHRLINIDEQAVVFSYKDYRKQASNQQMTLEAVEFIRRFSMHVLPRGYVRIRHYGILSSTCKIICIQTIKSQLPEKQIPRIESRILHPHNPNMCPHCKTETMVQIEILLKRGPPRFNYQIQNIH